MLVPKDIWLSHLNEKDAWTFIDEHLNSTDDASKVLTQITDGKLVPVSK